MPPVQVLYNGWLTLNHGASLSFLPFDKYMIPQDNEEVNSVFKMLNI
jgi:hypothetical protein